MTLPVVRPKAETTMDAFVESPVTVGRTSLSHDLPVAPNDSLDVLTMDMKHLVKKIQDLSHLGIEDSKITLPKICVVGDQSTGKSSLIEGISEIKVPRSAGTCTRCPLEINLSESEPGEPWKCVVHLSRRYWFDPDKKVNRMPKRSEPLGPWVSSGGQEDELFVTLTEKREVQNTLWWAQLAILNPRNSSQEYVPGKNTNTPTTTQVKFSPNVVRLDISAPNFPTLSFYDLPGVISQAEHDEERYLVRLVENLVKEFVSQKHCIVLLTLTMTDDATNSSAARIIRDIRGAKERTLGVLTKPDRVSEKESFAQWVEILEEKKFGLGHGYYVVRNNPDPSVDHSQARAEEEAFFATTFWTELAIYQGRFGTKQVQSALSALLLQQIQGCLPSIVTQIDEKANSIDAELNTLPDPPTEDVQRILIEKRITLGEQIRALIDGGMGIGSSHNPIQKHWNQLVMDFQKALAITRPSMYISALSDKQYLAEQVDSDCEMIMIGVSPSRKRKAPTADPKTPESLATGIAKRLGYSTPWFEEWEGPGRRFSLEEVRSIKEDSYRAGIPNQIDPRAIETLNRMSVQHWRKIMETFIGVTHKLVHDLLFKTLKTVFVQYRQTGLYRELDRIMNGYLGRLLANHLNHARDHFWIEYNKPFTMAQEQHKQAMQQALDGLCNARHSARARCYLELRGMSPDDERRTEKIRKITTAELGTDQFSQELEMMASSRGYYEIASSRFLDVICQSVQTKLFSKCRDELILAIDNELQIFGVNALDRCLELMAEHPERQRRRAELLREREKLRKAQEWLASARKNENADEDMMESEDTLAGSLQSMDWQEGYA